ncbi:MAG: hypothetical protein M1818_000788 [Claussenomyces sp. TS43310]|nr:MAG: hypothetical protein M1818_000788 [Claussenomyces sp. TS43310]
MPLRDLLKKRDKLNAEATSVPTAPQPPPPPQSPQVTFMRTDSHTQEIIYPPDYGPPPRASEASGENHRAHHHRFSLLKARSRAPSDASRPSNPPTLGRSSRSRRLSEAIGLRKEANSSNVPQNLPEIDEAKTADGSIEGQWEQRATILVQENERHRSGSNLPTGDDIPNLEAPHPPGGDNKGALSSQQVDDNLQEAIRLHEAGELVEATKMFGRLADPKGANNALSQVLYGLALRHGWGCTADPEQAMRFLSAAASNAAAVEGIALQAGRKQGGAAKGELVLAIFELANSFRHGWGIKKDPVAAKQYYETAANLGDTDAMNEVGWCYLEGFGCKKDKASQAGYPSSPFPSHSNSPIAP